MYVFYIFATIQSIDSDGRDLLRIAELARGFGSIQMQECDLLISDSIT